MKVYIASPLFNESELENNRKLNEMGAGCDKIFAWKLSLSR